MFWEPIFSRFEGPSGGAESEEWADPGTWELTRMLTLVSIESGSKYVIPAEL